MTTHTTESFESLHSNDVHFEPIFGTSGLCIHDSLEDTQGFIYTDKDISPTRTEADDFLFPVDGMVEISASRIRPADNVGIWIRSMDGSLVKFCQVGDEPTTIPAGDYYLDFGGIEMVIYGRCRNTKIEVSNSDQGVCLDFPEEISIEIGARPLHVQPAQTLTTTKDPADLMAAISLFGNAMKTWAPERAYPTLRGHPPLIELADEPDLPADLTPPDTGIRITAPPRHERVYPLATLAYWLGATVEPGQAAIHINGTTHPLGVAAGYTAKTEQEAFENHLKDILHLSFQLDNALRTESYYEIGALDTHEHIETSSLSLDYQALYDMSIADRLQAYLSLGEDYRTYQADIDRPEWRLTADIQPTPQQATVLPFLARDLAVIRSPSETRYTSPSSVNPTDVLSPTRQIRATSHPSKQSHQNTFVTLPSSDSILHTWVGNGFAVNAAKATSSSYLQRLENRQNKTTRISVDVVVNSDEMSEEATVSDIYGTRDHIDFDITIHRTLCVDELASVFEQDTNFIHYIGHISPEGFQCEDGHLSPNQLETVDADIFLLNACTSHQIGVELVDRGAIAGVVTFDDVNNTLATKFGLEIARLLNYGFPIVTATKLTQRATFGSGDYGVIGDSNAALAESNNATPNVVHVSVKTSREAEITMETFATWNYDIGSLYSPNIAPGDKIYTVPGEIGPWNVSEDTLDTFLDSSVFPVVVDGTLYWSNKVTANEILTQSLSHSS